ncbi:unnamed protein product [Dracunculus medinensis]|uniref:DAGKc domain-containing protein n=1 Tax=Dracunculus medinensis TaxID=318479 RepID=A0A0N4UI97_DRAME|nr:unnamed protein product [Dracunculus medinensis]
MALFILLQNAKHAETPNSLFLYFAENSKHCIWRIREVILVFTTSSEKKHWLDILEMAVSQLTRRPKRLLVFVNPYGGKGKAKRIYSNYVCFFFVELILEMAGITCEVFLTQRANHAYDHLRQLDKSVWDNIDGVVSVGGDGLFNECLSAIVCRTQEDASKDICNVNIDCLQTPRMRFGIIGAGSANSIVSSVHGTNDYSTAAIHIAIGSQCFVDVCTVHRGDDLMRISANAISYGWLGDVLADSERYRWMGPLRYQFSALRTTLRHPTYFGRISFKLIPELEDKSKAPVLPRCKKPCSLCDWYGVYPHHVQTDFAHVICCVIPCVSPFTPYGLAPFTGIGDGTMDLAILSNVTRCANLRFMRKVAMHGGKSVLKMSNMLNVFRVSQWMFTPESDNANQGSWNLDGESFLLRILHINYSRLHTRLIKYFGQEFDLNQPVKKRKCRCCRRKRMSNIILLD